MIGSPLRPITRQLCVALACAAAALFLPTPGLAGPIRLSNLASVSAQGIRAVFKNGRKNGRTLSRGGDVEVSDISSGAPNTRRGDLDLSDLSSRTGMTDFFGTLDNDGPEAYSVAAHLGDRFAGLADDLGDEASPDLTSLGPDLTSLVNRRSGDRWLGSSHETSERSEKADRLKASNSSERGGGVPIQAREPNTLILFGAGLIGVAMWMRRRIGAVRH